MYLSPCLLLKVIQFSSCGSFQIFAGSKGTRRSSHSELLDEELQEHSDRLHLFQLLCKVTNSLLYPAVVWITTGAVQTAVVMIIGLTSSLKQR